MTLFETKTFSCAVLSNSSLGCRTFINNCKVGCYMGYSATVGYTVGAWAGPENIITVTAQALTLIH